MDLVRTRPRRNQFSQRGPGGAKRLTAAVWTAADRVPFEKRVFVERDVARLQLQRGFTDADLDDAVRAALTGLIQSAA